MKSSKKKKGRILSVSTIALTLSVLATNIAAPISVSANTTESEVIAENRDIENLISTKNNKLIELDNESLIANVEPYVQVNKNGHIELSQNIEKEIYEHYKLDNLKEHFSKLNKQVDDELIIISDDLEITENISPNITILSSNYISTSTHWWGYRTVYNNSQAQAAAQRFRDYALGFGTIGGLGVVVPGIGPAVSAAGGLTASYSNLVANRIDANNNGNGVILDMTWVAVFSVSSR